MSTGRMSAALMSTGRMSTARKSAARIGAGSALCLARVPFLAMLPWIDSRADLRLFKIRQPRYLTGAPRD